MTGPTLSGRGSPAASSEEAALELIESMLPTAPTGEIWFGDDAAVVDVPAGSRLVLATDMVVSGVHADLRLVGLDDLGWKALATAVSDLAAMGAEPGHALVSVAAQPDTDLALLYEGIVAAAAELRCPVVGGDLSSSGGPLVVSVAVTGFLGNSDRPVTRGGAEPGHLLFVTGPLGGSAAGLDRLRSKGGSGSASGGSGGVAGVVGVGETYLATPEDLALIAAHRRPRARLIEGRTARQAGAGAMIDVSDGLGIDLHRLADASGVGFALEDIPVAGGATWAQAVGGGEDYELVVAVENGDSLRHAFEQAGLRAPLEIGRCVVQSAGRTYRGADLSPAGWEHRW